MPDGRLYSVADLRRRVAANLGSSHRAMSGEVTGDHTFSPDLGAPFLDMERRAAAVLVPIVDRDPETTMLFTVRHGGLNAHAGEIALPGGRIDPDDASPEAAALREADEEIGLSSVYVETLCRAPDYLTGSGYRVTPVVAIVRPGFRLRLNPAEVDDVFEAPMSFLMRPENHRVGSRSWRGIERTFFEMPYGDRHIWGITAGMVRILYERLYADDAEPGR